MKEKAVVILKGTKYILCCDAKLTREFYEYISKDTRHYNEIKQIFFSICEGLSSRKYSDEPYGTMAMKPFLNNENDRIICQTLKRKNKKRCIIMVEFFYSKKTNNNDKRIIKRYELASKKIYEIIE